MRILSKKNGYITEMIKFEKYSLKNGLTVILHKDQSTPLVTVNVLYKVGSRNEDYRKTGFAHLFEHLMFGGSENIPDYDTPIQVAGGDNNAFTNKDLTNFYNIMPADNLETALWLESDRMKQLDFNQKSLDTQKKVVVEEFKETSINKPYGDLWHNMSELAFKVHPYQWPTIGRVPAHIEEANLDDVKSFFNKYYRPSNAVLVIAGNIEIEQTKSLVEKWFAGISSEAPEIAALPIEPPQTEFRQRILKREIPADALYIAFHIPDRLDKDFGGFDILSDIFSGGKSARFYQNLLKGTSIFSSVYAYITGSIDPGLFVIEAKLIGENKIDEARDLIWKELDILKTELVSDTELQKVKNSLISSISFSEVSIMHKAINLAYYEMLKDAELINKQEEDYVDVQTSDLQRLAQQTFVKENCSEIVYLRENA